MIHCASSIGAQGAILTITTAGRRGRMKLTAAIAASYFGAEYTVDTDSIVRKVNWRFFQLIDVLSNPKLILTPLEKISEADAVVVAKIIMPLCFANRKNGWKVTRDYAVTGYPYIKIHHPKKVWSVQIDPTLINFDVDGMEDRATGQHDMKPVEVIDYLRSKGYDCGYGSIPNLIAAGVAVEKENQ